MQKVFDPRVFALSFISLFAIIGVRRYRSSKRLFKKLWLWLEYDDFQISVYLKSKIQMNLINLLYLNKKCKTKTVW